MGCCINSSEEVFQYSYIIQNKDHIRIIVDEVYPDSEYDISNQISSLNYEGINKITINTENNNSDLFHTETQNTQAKTETSYVERDFILKPKGRLETVRETNSEFSCSKKADEIKNPLSKKNSLYIGGNLIYENSSYISGESPSQLSKLASHSCASFKFKVLHQASSYNPEIDNKEKYLSDDNTKNTSFTKNNDKEKNLFEVDESKVIKRGHTIQNKTNHIIS